jgi:cytidylate kinase
MAVITVAYQVGSQGRTIGQQLADRLGLDYVDREIVQGVAERLHVSEEAASQWDERVERLVTRLLTVLGSARQSTYPVYVPASEPILNEQVYFETMRAVIEAAGATNHVLIVGHGANFVLGDRPGVLHLFLYTARERRIETFAAREQVSRAEAERLVDRNDHDRALYVKRFYRRDWRDPTSYHMMVNTAMLPLPQIVDLLDGVARDWIVGQTVAPQEQPPPSAVASQS